MPAKNRKVVIIDQSIYSLYMVRRNAELVCVAGHRRDEYTAEPAGGHQEIYEPRNTRLEVFFLGITRKPGFTI
jgi:hypothetical protein